MTEYKAVIKNKELAEKFEKLSSQYENDLIKLLEEAKETELPNDFLPLSRTVGHVLATLGESIFFPIYREHPSLTPEQLRDIIEK